MGIISLVGAIVSVLVDQFPVSPKKPCALTLTWKLPENPEGKVKTPWAVSIDGFVPVPTMPSTFHSRYLYSLIVEVAAAVKYWILFVRNLAPATPKGAKIVQEGSASRVWPPDPHLAVVTAGVRRLGIVLVTVSALIRRILVTKTADKDPHFDWLRTFMVTVVPVPERPVIQSSSQLILTCWLWDPAADKPPALTANEGVTDQR